MNFEWALHSWLGYDPPVCQFSRICGMSMVLESNGDVYSCDHFVRAGNLLGNIHVDGLETIVGNRKQIEYSFSPESSSVVSETEWKEWCQKNGVRALFVRRAAARDFGFVIFNPRFSMLGASAPPVPYSLFRVEHQTSNSLCFQSSTLNSCYLFTISNLSMSCTLSL